MYKSPFLNEIWQVPETPIVNSSKGEPIKVSAFKTAWQRLKMRFPKDIPYFTFHDLKAKGVSDFDGDKQIAEGHKDQKMVAIYDRKRKVTA